MTQDLTVGPGEVQVQGSEQHAEDWDKIQRLVLQGDLGALSKPQQAIYLKSLCDQHGLDWRSRPFQLITAQGRTFLYATRDAADQLRKLHKISIQILERVLTDQVFYVRARATTPDGREDESLGAVGILGLKGDNMANAMMKAETKAKRRVTYSISGLGISDESEVGTIPEVKAAQAVPRRLSPGPMPDVSIGAVKVVLPEEGIVEGEVVQSASEGTTGAPEGVLAQPTPGPKLKARLPPAVAPIAVKKA